MIVQNADTNEVIRWQNPGVYVQGVDPATGSPVALGQQTASTSTTAATITQGTKAVTTAGTPVLLVASQTLVENVVIQAFKTPSTANTGNVYIGISASGGSNRIVLAPGQSVSFDAPAGKKLDLNTIYVDAATSADAVQYTAIN